MNMRMATQVVLVAALLASTGCGGNRTGCYQVSSACTVTCAALPGQVFAGNVVAPGLWSTMPNPTAEPVTVVDGICRGGSNGPAEAAACFSATPPSERQASISCDCQPWTVVDDNASCDAYYPRL
jgi:hypothetical protein